MKMFVVTAMVYNVWSQYINTLGRVRKPKNRISRILPPGIVVCWSCLSISEATLKPNLPLLSLRINAFLLFA